MTYAEKFEVLGRRLAGLKSRLAKETQIRIFAESNKFEIVKKTYSNQKDVLVEFWRKRIRHGSVII